MLWLLTLLALILAATLALGGLIFGAINVISMGFAAILLGLAVDYAVVHYQEALAQPELSIPEIRRAIAPSIFWAAVTTISAFLVLNFGGLPGLAQLGSLVGIGVAISAGVMIFAFLPPSVSATDAELTVRAAQNPKASVDSHVPCSNPLRAKFVFSGHGAYNFALRRDFVFRSAKNGSHRQRPATARQPGLHDARCHQGKSEPKARAALAGDFGPR